MEENYKKYLKFDHRILIVGFGSIGQAILPLLFRHLDIKPEQVTILTKKAEGEAIAREFDVKLIAEPVAQDNYQQLLSQHLKSGDFLLNLSVDVSSLALIEYCQQHGVLYLDTCIEPWTGGYTDQQLPIEARSNYALRENVLKLKKNTKSPTALVTHGANPGLVSHFFKQALLNIAHDLQLSVSKPTTAAGWAKLAQQLNIKVVHIAERDTQISHLSKKPGEFVNTWSIDGFVSEGSQPAELGWGTHERHWPKNASQHTTGSQCAIYLNQPGAATRVRTWTPLTGAQLGFLITHGEAISIADYFTVQEEQKVTYRPTVHYAYHPCHDAVLSLHELAGREWVQQAEQRLLFNDIADGIDELGVLLMGNAKGAYWYGSQLSIHEARRLVPHNNATSLQVAVSVLGGMVWAIRHPEAGIVEPEEIDDAEVLAVAMPYLGKVGGHYTSWTPLQDRSRLFPEEIDADDPWQFCNILVN